MNFIFCLLSIHAAHPFYLFPSISSFIGIGSVKILFLDKSAHFHWAEYVSSVTLAAHRLRIQIDIQLIKLTTSRSSKQLTFSLCHRLSLYISSRPMWTNQRATRHPNQLRRDSRCLMAVLMVTLDFAVKTSIQTNIHIHRTFSRNVVMFGRELKSYKRLNYTMKKCDNDSFWSRLSIR